MTRTAVYIRVSTAKQSVDSQKREIAAYLSAHSIHVDKDDWFVDVASGANLDRAAFSELQRLVLEKSVTQVIMFSLDRMCRSLVDGLMEIELWQGLKCRLVFVSDGIDINLGDWFGNAMLKAIVAMKLAFAEAEREKIRTRQAAGIEAAREMQKNVKRLQAKGWGSLAISNRLKQPEGKVKRIMKHQGKSLWYTTAANKRRLEYDPKRLERIGKMRASGLTQAEVAAAMGLSIRCVRKYDKKIKADANGKAVGSGTSGLVHGDSGGGHVRRDDAIVTDSEQERIETDGSINEETGGECDQRDLPVQG